MEPICARLVGLFPLGGSAESHNQTGEMGAQAYPEMLLVEMGHDSRGRLRRLRLLGIEEADLGAAYSSRGAWRLASGTVMHTALSNAVLKQRGFLFPSEIAKQ